VVTYQGRTMVATITNDVLSAKDAQIFISVVNPEINKLDSDLIFDPKNGDKYFYISKSIGSDIKIVKVDIIDESLIDSFFS